MTEPYRLPMSSAEISADDIASIVQAVESGMLNMGSFIEKFEKEFAEYTGNRFAVAVSSGTAALHLCMIAAQVGSGDEVITTPFSFIASANSITYEGAKPAFVDIDEETLNIDTALMQSALTKRTRAILPVHVFGQPCDMDEIGKFAEANRLIVIEDACEALGADYRNRRAGTFGKAAAFGFFPNKQMTTGEGGMIVTDDPEWDDLFRSMRNQGRGSKWLQHPRIGFNYRLNEMSAALGVSQLRRIETLLAKRADVAHRYNQALNGIAGIAPLRIAPTTTKMSWFVYVLRLAPAVDREKVMAALLEDGIPSRPYFAALHLQPPYRARYGYKEGDFPVTESVSASVLALPFHANMTDEHIEMVRDGLIRAIRLARR